MQYRFNNIFLLALLPAVLATPKPVPEPAPEPSKSNVKKSCTYDGCTGETGVSGGTYCGFCKQVVGWGSVGFAPWDIFQIAGGSSTSCCEYGYNQNCDNLWNEYYAGSNNVEVDC